MSAVLDRVRRWWSGHSGASATAPGLVVRSPRKRSLTGRRRTVRAQLPHHYFTDGNRAVSVTGTYGLLRFVVHDVELSCARRRAAYFVVVSIGNQTLCSRKVRATASGSVTLEWDASSAFVLQRGGAVMACVALYRAGRYKGALSNTLEAWCTVDLSRYFEGGSGGDQDTLATLETAETRELLGGNDVVVAASCAEEDLQAINPGSARGLSARTLDSAEAPSPSAAARPAQRRKAGDPARCAIEPETGLGIVQDPSSTLVLHLAEEEAGTGLGREEDKEEKEEEEERLLGPTSSQELASREETEEWMDAGYSSDVEDGEEEEEEEEEEGIRGGAMLDGAKPRKNTALPPLPPSRSPRPFARPPLPAPPTSSPGGPDVVLDHEWVDLVDPGDARIVLGRVRVSGRASTLQEMESQMWRRLLSLADFGGTGRVHREAFEVLMQAFGAVLSAAELDAIWDSLSHQARRAGVRTSTATGLGRFGTGPGEEGAGEAGETERSSSSDEESLESPRLDARGPAACRRPPRSNSRFSEGVLIPLLARALTRAHRRGQLSRLLRRCPVDGAELPAGQDASNVLYISLALDGGGLSAARVVASPGPDGAGVARARGGIWGMGSGSAANLLNLASGVFGRALHRESSGEDLDRATTGEGAAARRGLRPSASCDSLASEKLSRGQETGPEAKALTTPNLSPPLLRGPARPPPSLLRAGYCTPDQASRAWLMHATEWLTHPLAGAPTSLLRGNAYVAGGLRRGAAAAHIVVQERRSKRLVEERLSGLLCLALRSMYQSSAGRLLKREGALARLTKLSVDKGLRMDSPASVADIAPFLRLFRHEIRLEEVEQPLESFRTFNEFFYRRLKPGARLVAGADDPAVVVSAADCRLLVYDVVDDATRLWIKGCNFSIAGLLDDRSPGRSLAATFARGTLALFRLAPQDYHRFHAPLAGRVLSITDVAGALLSVNPIAVNSSYADVFTENKRSVLLLDAPGVGRVAFVAVGATLVGSIRWTVQEGQLLAKGEELGYFAFGGSTCVLLLPDAAPVAWDEDLRANSHKSLETLVKVGEQIGLCQGGDQGRDEDSQESIA